MRLKTFDDLGNLRDDIIGYWDVHSGYGIINFDTDEIRYIHPHELDFLEDDGYTLIRLVPR